MARNPGLTAAQSLVPKEPATPNVERILHRGSTTTWRFSNSCGECSQSLKPARPNGNVPRCGLQSSLSGGDGDFPKAPLYIKSTRVGRPGNRLQQNSFTTRSVVSGEP